MGNFLENANRFEEAEKAYQKAIRAKRKEKKQALSDEEVMERVRIKLRKEFKIEFGMDEDSD